jgi:hypothetical protein
MTRTRRQFLASGGAAGAALLPGWVPFFGGDDTDADTDDRTPTTTEREDQYGVTIDYPEEWLQRYRPAFVADRDTMQKSIGLFAHRVQYPESDYQYAYYWHRLSFQEGILFDQDSHLGDTEPCIVRVDSNGTVDRVTYTFYHHLADTVEGERLTRALQSRAVGDETHIQLRIIAPWHNYAVVEGTPDRGVTFLDVQGDTRAEHLRTWETRGVFDATADEAVWDPRTVQDRGSWWNESTPDYQVAQLYLQLGQYIDIAGSGDINR